MSILTYGDENTEVETMLRLATAVDIDDPDSAKSRQSRLIVHLLDAIEARVRSVTGRRFEAASYSDVAIDVEPSRRRIVLPDRPIISWTSIKEVTELGTDGLPSDTYTVPKDEYAVDSTEGKLIRYSGCWISGPQSHLITCELGYSAEDIATPVDDDIRTLKNVIAAVLAREYKRFLEGVHHVNTMSFGDTSTSFRIFLLPLEEAQLVDLKREVY